MKKYILESYNRYIENRKEYYLNSVPVFVINPLPSDIDLEYVLEEIASSVPNSFIDLVDGIYIGQFPELKNREIQAMLKDGAIYLSNFEDEDEVTESVIIDDIIHEIAHAIEDKYHSILYDDGVIEKEYIGKKKRLMDILEAEGEEFDKYMFFSDNVDKFDDFLYNDIGYDRLSLTINGLFISPYSVTTLREYFSNGFEEYIRGDRLYLKQTCPYLFYKIDELINMELYDEL
jgi:hypothetical protein